jgi:hypothetical protein
MPGYKRPVPSLPPPGLPGAGPAAASRNMREEIVGLGSN